MAGKSILIVDDDPSIRRVVSFWLQAEGMRVLQAGSGEQAVETLHRSRIDAVVTDVRLPGIDGRALAEQVRRLTPEPPVYVMSAFPRAEGIDADRFFRKPDELGDLVRELLAETPKGT